jgi:DNA-binding helix-hairpin-helix protein with protein kinase domain
VHRDRFVGYTMRRIEVQRDFVPLYQVVSAARRGALGGVLGWDRLVLLALRISHVVRTLHRMHYAIGDLNDRNILVSRRLTPLFLDTDSFEVPRGVFGRYPCRVGDRLYWPPELLGVDLDKHQASRMPGDRYALAVVVFQLLLNGMRPYQARGRLVQGLDTLEKKTLAGVYPWASPQRGRLEPPAGAPDYLALPRSIRRQFEAAFVAGHGRPRRRPSADDWHRVLKRVIQDGFETCTRHALHRYASSAGDCPWCADPNDPFRAPGSSPVRRGRGAWNFRRPRRALNAQHLLRAPRALAPHQLSNSGFALRAPP